MCQFNNAIVEATHTSSMERVVFHSNMEGIKIGDLRNCLIVSRVHKGYSVTVNSVIIDPVNENNPRSEVISYNPTFSWSLDEFASQFAEYAVRKDPTLKDFVSGLVNIKPCDKPQLGLFELGENAVKLWLKSLDNLIGYKKNKSSSMKRLLRTESLMNGQELKVYKTFSHIRPKSKGGNERTAFKIIPVGQDEVKIEVERLKGSTSKLEAVTLAFSRKTILMSIAEHLYDNKCSEATLNDIWEYIPVELYVVDVLANIRMELTEEQLLNLFLVVRDFWSVMLQSEIEAVA